MQPALLVGPDGCISWLQCARSRGGIYLVCGCGTGGVVPSAN